MKPLDVSMASYSNIRFMDGFAGSSSYNSNMVSFESGGGISSNGFSDQSRVFAPGNPGSMSNVVPIGVSSGNPLLDPLPRLKRDTGLAAGWSSEEHAMLREGLVRYAGDHSIMKYIKIAAMLRDKNIRDVALRCRWMNEHGKRRKADEQYARRKLKDTKGKMMDSYSKVNVNVHTDSLDRTLFYSHQENHKDLVSSEASALDGPARNLMDENALAFRHIAANLATFKIEDNINLFLLTRNNITSILISMSEMPGIMSLMPPLPISVDEQRLSIILPGTSQVVMFGGLEGIFNLKQEPK